MDLSDRRVDPDREAAVPEDVDHLVVLGQDRRLELLDPGGGRERRELSYQERSEASALHPVGDREADLGAAWVDRPVVGVADDVAVVERQQAEAAALDPAIDQVLEVRDPTEEAEVPGLGRECLVEGDQRVAIGGRGRPEVDGRAVLEHGVDLTAAVALRQCWMRL